MPLHLDYRPRVLEEFFGNEELVASLRSVMGREDRPHAYLFSGHYGCGKTTLGRIVAAELGCIGPDYMEIDGAQAKGIQNIRDLKRASRYAPMAGPCKVYLIDECHRLTGDAADAMLKELEDTPKHVYYILCTNEVQNLKGSIKSRCTEYNVKKLKPMEMRKLLNWINTDAGLNISDKILVEIVKAAEGVARTGVKILDAVYTTEKEEDQIAVIQSYHGEESAEIIDLCRALLENKPWKELASVLGKLQEEDPVKCRFAIMGYLKAVLLKSKDNGNKAGMAMAPYMEIGQYCTWPELVHATWQTTLK